MHRPAGHGKDGHDRILRLETTLHMQRLPGGAFFVLGKAHGVFHRIAQNRPFDAARSRAADIADDQPQRAPDGGVGTVPRAQSAQAAVQPDLVHDRPVHHHNRRRAHGCRGDPVDVEFIRADGFHGGDHHGQIFGLTPCHHRIDRDLFDRGDAHVWRHCGDDILRITVRPF